MLMLRCFGIDRQLIVSGPLYDCGVLCGDTGTVAGRGGKILADDRGIPG